MDSTKIVIKRVEEERDELKKKVNVLTKTIMSFNKNVTISENQKELLKQQYEYMKGYLYILEKRLKMFKDSDK